VSEVIFGYAVNLMVVAPNGNIVVIDSVMVGSDKKFSSEFTAGGSLMKASGEYTIQLVYVSEKTTKEITFSYNDDSFVPPEPEPIKEPEPKPIAEEPTEKSGKPNPDASLEIIGLEPRYAISDTVQIQVKTSDLWFSCGDLYVTIYPVGKENAIIDKKYSQQCFDTENQLLPIGETFEETIDIMGDYTIVAVMIDKDNKNRVTESEIFRVELEPIKEPTQEPEPEIPCQTGSMKEKSQCRFDLFEKGIDQIEISSFDTAKYILDGSILSLAMQSVQEPPTEEELTEFIGEERRKRQLEVLEKLEKRNLNFNSISALLYSSRISDYERSVILEMTKDAIELTKYKFAEILYYTDQTALKIKNKIQNSNLSENEKSSIIEVFDGYVEKRKVEVGDIMGNQIISTQSEISSVQTPRQIAEDVGDYYVEISNERTLKSISGGGCLIATATYGSELAPQVQQLRELRDNKLLQTESGSAFMNTFNDFYYSFSPVIADYERENPVFKEAVKITLTPLLISLSLLNYVDMDSEESVLGYGISLILLNVGMYVGVPTIVVVGIRRKV